jgi:hypothetical protein
MNIERWFQGSDVCGQREIRPALFIEDGDGSVMPRCLLMVMPWGEEAALLRIIERHFSARACRCDDRHANRIVHFNNNPETTREDIDKVLRIYTEETE